MSRAVLFTAAAWDDYTYWQGQDKKTLRRINVLIESARRDPFDGIGKPEALVGNLSGYWSRRIDDVHRLVYAADDDELAVIACRGCDDTAHLGLLAFQFVHVNKSAANLEGADGCVVFVLQPQLAAEARFEQRPVIGRRFTNVRTNERLGGFDFAQGWQRFHPARLGMI